MPAVAVKPARDMDFLKNYSPNQGQDLEIDTLGGNY